MPWLAMATIARDTSGRMARFCSYGSGPPTARKRRFVFSTILVPRLSRCMRPRSRKLLKTCPCFGRGLMNCPMPSGTGTKAAHPCDRGGPLPRVTPETRDRVVHQSDIKGTEAFTLEIIEDLRGNNPELLTMAHDFAERQVDYLRVMQGLALFYKSLVDQSAADRTFLH